MTQPNPDPNNPNPTEVTFTAEQQSKIDEIVKKAMGRAAAETRQALETEKQARLVLDQKLKEAEEALKKASTKTGKEDAQDDIDTLKRQITEMKDARTAKDNEFESLKRKLGESENSVTSVREQLTAERKSNMIANLAMSQNFIDTDAVIALTGKHFKWSDAEGKFIVINEDGTPKMNSEFDPMTPAEFLKDFAVKKPFMVKSDVRTGTGSQDSQRSGLPTGTGHYKVDQIFGPKSNSASANELAKKNPAEYKRLKAEAKRLRIIA